MTRESLQEFRAMIEHAVDREELEDLRRMILEASDVSFDEKRQLGNYLEMRYKTAPELRGPKVDRQRPPQ